MRYSLNKLLLIIIVCLQFSNLAGATVKVCASCEHTTIQSALEMALPDDTVLVSGGQYLTEKIVIHQPVALIGIDRPELISKQGEEIITVLSHHVTISGFTFRDVTTSYMEERAAIRVKRRRNFTITNNEIYNCFFGVYLERASNGKIINNKISSTSINEASSGNAIHAWNCKNLVIKNNELTGHRDGIYFEFVDSSLIEANHSENNLRYGLHFMFSNNDVYQNNVFSENGAGVAVMFSKKINMYNNEFVNNWGRSSYGLLLKEIYDAEISGNHFTNNTLGIYVEGSSRILYTSNIFERNGWALKFAGGSIDNKIIENNFINNTLDLMLGSSFKDNIIESNYWSNYTGYDLDRDGIGDIPYYPVKLFAYILDQCPETIVLLRSLFIDVLNYSEKVSPIFTPKNVQDPFPKMSAFQ